MNRKHYSPFHSLIQRMAATRLVASFLSHFLHYIDRPLLKWTNNRFSLTSFLAGIPVITLTTTGAKSGIRRTVPLVCILDGQDPTTFALIASNWGQRHYPAWYHNLKAHPRATCSIFGQAAEYQAHEATREEYGKFWQGAVETYMGFALYKERACNRRIPIMVMRPIAKTNEK
ncbi:MAG: nitroreductase family deazaflavin-dependent oxidoreductase [Chloroflexi bacterium]|nr:nitroreductase family deazaflavin-dependent oxidoreductase [Chloroflexota bacterium]